MCAYIQKGDMSVGEKVWKSAYWSYILYCLSEYVYLSYTIVANIIVSFPCAHKVLNVLCVLTNSFNPHHHPGRKVQSSSFCRAGH